MTSRVPNRATSRAMPPASITLTIDFLPGSASEGGSSAQTATNPRRPWNIATSARGPGEGAPVRARGDDLEPVRPAERPVQAQAGHGHDPEHDVVAVGPPQLGHVVEVHAVYAGDHRGHRGDGDQARDLAHVAVLLDRD